MIIKYLESTAYVVAFMVIGLAYLECVLSIAGNI